MNLTCSSCSTVLTARNLSPHLGVVTCPKCGALQKLEAPPVGSPMERLLHAVSSRLLPPSRPVGPVPRPERFTLQRSSFGGAISYRWFSFTSLFLVFFSLFWNSITFTFAVTMIAAQDWRGLLFLSLHLVVGIGVGWYTLASLLNRTDIAVHSGALTVRWGPIWWPGQKTEPTKDIMQFWVAERIQRGKNGTTCAYDVMAILAEGASTSVIKGLPKLEEALFIEQTLEEWLSIDDQPVPGEVGSFLAEPSRIH